MPGPGDGGYKPIPTATPLHIVVVRNDVHSEMPLKAGQRVLMLGNITNMPGHCAVADHAGKVWWGMHPSDFRTPNEDEV